ncbi:MAG: gutB 5 [Clostridia bacterium]|jgi:threonine dehydrogenase-like Zn-dependent dehydrogenase|nr:gutB 5 [Clostridia bacterium]
MKAAYYLGPSTIEVEEADIPKINEEEILIKVKACAICGTDLRIYKSGHFKIPSHTKRVLGHEIAGEIIGIGAKVKGYSIGMRVATPPNIGCGTCNSCRQGFNQLCPDYEAFGISLDGGFQEYMKVPAYAIKAGNVIEIPDHLSFEEAVVTEPLSCCYNSYKALKTVPGDTVLVIGAGPIGALHVMINKLAGATKIIAADLSDERLNEIKELGADIVINSAKENLREAVIKETHDMGADVIITACSVPELQYEALEMAAVHGRINYFGGLPKGKENVTLNTNLIHYKELTVLGTTGSSILDYYKSMQIIASGKINAKALISNKFRIEEIDKAFECAAAGKGMKTIIVFP